MPAQNVSVSATFEPAEEPYTHYTSTSGKVTAVSLYNGGTENDAAAKTYAQLITDGVTTKKVGEGSGDNNNKPGVKFEKDILLANQFNESGSDITAESTDDASITVLKVDATGVDKTSNRLELCLDVESAHTAGTSGNTDVILRQVADIDDLDALTFTSLTKSKGTTTNLGNVKPGNPIKVALDITSALKAEDDNTISYLITAKSPREIKIISPELKVTPVYALTKSSSMTEGDVKFKVKDAEVTAAAESEEVTLDITVPDGKEITEVSYTPNGDSKQVITDTDGVYKFTMPAKAVEVNVTFAEKKGTPVTSLTLVYSTTNDAEQTINQDKKVEDEGLLTNKMVEETVEIPSKYKAPILVPSGLDDGQYDVYVYDDTCLDSEITLNAAEATQVVKVKQLDGKHYYYENFDALPKATADGDKTDAATDTFFKLTNSNKDRTSARVYNNLTINGVNLKQVLGVKGDNNNANTTMQISADGIGGTGKNVSVSFKASLGAGNQNCKGTPHLSIRDTSQKALFTTSDSTGGYFGGLTINDTTLSKYAAGSAENGFSTVAKGAGGWNNYDVTYVWDVNVDVDFTNKAAHMVITEEGTSRTLYEDYYTTDISNIADLYFDLANIGAVIVDDIDIKPFADSIEKMYTATVTAVPGATVTISGQSTSGKSISKSGVAGGDGKAAVKDVLAGTSYTINATAPNKYRKAATPLESQEVGEGKTEFSISIPYDTEQYNNLIYGDDFESLAADTAVIGGTQSGAMITNGDPFDIWKFTAGTNNYDKFIIRADNGPEDPNTVSKKAHDGQFAYAVSYSGDSSYVGTASEDISSIEFDTCLDGVAGSKGGTGFMDTLFKFGDTTLFTMTANPESSTASLDTIGIVVGEQKLVSSAGDHPWVHVKITGLNTESATVEITKYSDGTTLSVVPDDKITGTVSIADVGAKTGFSIVGAKTNGIGTKQHSGMALDNFEVYSAGE